MAMISTSQRQLTTASAAVARWMAGVLKEMAPVVLFFFVALMLIFLLLKLFVAQYSIEFYAFSEAAIGALILGKVVTVMDWAVSGKRVRIYPRAVAIIGKTFLYGLAVFALRFGERIIHSIREAGSLRGGLELVIANADLNRFLGLVLLISLTVGSYLAMREIDHAMGKGALFRLFFKRPVDNPEP